MIITRLSYACQKLVRKIAEVSLAVIRSGNAGRGRALNLRHCTLVRLNPAHGADEIGDRARLVEKTRALVVNQLGDPRDRRCQHEPSVSHRFHQHHKPSARFKPAPLAAGLLS